MPFGLNTSFPGLNPVIFLVQKNKSRKLKIVVVIENFGDQYAPEVLEEILEFFCHNLHSVLEIQEAVVNCPIVYQNKHSHCLY